MQIVSATSSWIKLLTGDLHTPILHYTSHIRKGQHIHVCGQVAIVFAVQITYITCRLVLCGKQHPFQLLPKDSFTCI